MLVPEVATVTRRPGRPRDEQATRAILSAAVHQLVVVGFGRVSMDSVAAEAGVSRATVYRRFRGKADLITAAVEWAGADTGPLPSPDPRTDLVAYLTDFDARFAESALEVVGGLLGLRDEPRAMELHRRRVVGPRTGYVRALLQQGHDEGRLPGDVELLVQLLTGAVLARRLMGVPPDEQWAEAAVAVVWPATPASPPPPPPPPHPA
jgi:AcrR family transcriptional regulator